MKKAVLWILAAVALMTLPLTGCATQEHKMNGKFYLLQEAFDQKLLTVNDLKNIAYYHGSFDKDSENFTPLPKSPENLNAEVTIAIKQDAAYKMRNNELTPVKEAKAADFLIIKYYGIYNGSVTIMMNDPYHEYPAEELDINEVIAGVIFNYTNPNRIIVWKQIK